MSEKKPVEKENVIFGSIKSTKNIYQDDSQKANNFNILFLKIYNI